jgi:lycopene beta-cyclase
MDNNSTHLQQELTYDIIIAGAGCAGLSLLYSVLQSPVLKGRKILVLDKSFEKSNDRTWCFWESNPGSFQSLVCKQWDHISIHKASFSKELATAPYSYKMIQGLDFYNHIIQYAKQFSNVIWEEAVVSSIETDGDFATVQWEGGKAKSNKVFSSILPMDTLYTISQSNISKPFLWQHFKGLLVQFESNVFNPGVARLMDFNVDQKDATGFMYLLPLNESKALVEYTLFSKTILPTHAYDIVLKAYLDKHYPNMPYTILHEELGAIPMTTQAFAKSIAPIFVIGTLGNAVKSSTGYAFHFIQEQVKQIVHQLENGEVPITEVHYTRHQFYDAVLLYILHHNLMEGSEIFKRIFEQNNAATIFKFLSNTSTLWEDIQIMRSLPTKIFLPAAIKVLARRS